MMNVKIIAAFIPKNPLDLTNLLQLANLIPVLLDEVIEKKSPIIFTNLCMKLKPRTVESRFKCSNSRVDA